MNNIKLLRPLRESQKEGLLFFLENKIVGMRHGTGQGKTTLALAAAAVLLKRDLVDVAFMFIPKNGVIVFKEDLKYTTLDALFMENVEDYVPGKHVYIIQHQHTYRFVDLINNINGRVLGVIDEIQAIKTPQTELRRVFLEIRGTFDEWFIGFSATPISKVIDMYHIVEYMRPGAWGSVWQFKNKYCEMKEKYVYQNGIRRKYYDIVGYKNLDLLAQEIDKIWHTSIIEMDVDFKEEAPKEYLSPEEEEIYLLAAKGILEEEKGVKIPLNRLQDLQKVVDESETKKRMVGNLVKELVAQDKGVVVYFERKISMKDLAEKTGVEYRILDGKLSVEKREEIKKWFGKGKVIYMTRAGSRSLGFQSGNQVVFYECPWDLEVFVQTIGRCARPFVSTYDKVDVWIPIIKNTIDEYRRLYVEMNGEILKKILKGGESRLPNNVLGMRREIFVRMRKDLLWRIQKKKN